MSTLVCTGCGRPFSPLESKILRALAPRPMTAAQIATFLGIKHSLAANVAARLERRHVILRHPQTLPGGGSEYVYRKPADEETKP